MQQDDMPHRLLEAYLGRLGADETATREMTSLFRIVHYRKGDSFSAEGEKAERLGFVVDGVFSMFTVQEDGRLFVKDFPAKEQFLLAAFDPGGPALVSIRPLTNALVLEARYSAVCALLEKYPEFERAAKRGAERRMEDLHKRLESFATMDARDRYRLFKKNLGNLEDRIPQYLVASYLGVTPTQLSRIRSGR